MERARRRRGRSTATGPHYLDVLSGILGYAQDLGLLDANPVKAFRETLRRRSGTQRSRAETDPRRHIRPLEESTQIARLVAEAEVEGPAPSRARAVAPRRGPAPGRGAWSALVLRGETEGSIDPWNFRKRQWRRILERAGIGQRALKDLRDTYASHLLSAGVQLGYVSAQLGHADVGRDGEALRRWAGGDLYREPMQLKGGRGTGRLPRPARRESHQSRSRVPPPPTWGSGTGKSAEFLGVFGAGNGSRTRDPQLGKLMLYQLSYSRAGVRLARRDAGSKSQGFQRSSSMRSTKSPSISSSFGGPSSGRSPEPRKGSAPRVPESKIGAISASGSIAPCAARRCWAAARDGSGALVAGDSVGWPADRTVPWASPPTS